MTDNTDNHVIAETEWSYFLDIGEIEGGRHALSISPDDGARKRLAQRLGLVSLDVLKADIVVERRSGEATFHVKGRMEAEVTQSCVVTLEPVADRIRDDFEAWFADPGAAVSIARLRHERQSRSGHGEVPVLSEKDDPEPLSGGKIDLGELVTQYLSLSVNPYPHAEGAVFEVGDDGPGRETPEALRNPFAALKDWKAKPDGEGH